MIHRLFDHYTLLLVLIAAGFTACVLGYPLTSDSSSYFMIGRTLLEGGYPYRDAWDVKGPAIYLVNALFQVLQAKGALGFRILDGLWQMLTALCAASMAMRIYKRPVVAFFAGFGYLAFYFSQNFWSWLQSDSYVSLPLGLAFLAMLMAMESGCFWQWTAAGAGIAVATLFKFPLGGLGIGMMAVACLHGGFDARRAVRRLSGLAAGFLAPILVCIAYLYSGGALDAYLEAQIAYAPQYTKIIRDNYALDCLWRGLTGPEIQLFYWACGLLAVGIFVRGRRARPSLVEGTFLFWIAFTYAIVWAQAVLFKYHYHGLIIPLMTLTAGTMVLLHEERKGSRFWRIAIPVIAIVIFLVPMRRMATHARATYRVFFAPESHADPNRDLAKYLNEHTGPDERILVWSNAANVYLMANRRPASRFLAMYPLSYDVKGMPYPDQLVADLQASRPAYIAVMDAKPIFGQCGTPMDPQGFLDAIPRFVALLQSDYALETEVGPFRVFRRKQ